MEAELSHAGERTTTTMSATMTPEQKLAILGDVIREKSLLSQEAGEDLHDNNNNNNRSLCSSLSRDEGVKRKRDEVAPMEDTAESGRDLPPPGFTDLHSSRTGDDEEDAEVKDDSTRALFALASLASPAKPASSDKAAAPQAAPQQQQQQQQVPAASNVTATTTNTAATGTAEKKSSPYRGITKRKRGWEAHVWRHGKQQYLGGYADEKAAARAYDMAVIKIRGEGAETNFPRKDYADALRNMRASELTVEAFISQLREVAKELSKRQRRDEDVKRSEKVRQLYDRSTQSSPQETSAQTAKPGFSQGQLQRLIAELKAAKHHQYQQQHQHQAAMTPDASACSHQLAMAQPKRQRMDEGEALREALRTMDLRRLRGSGLQQIPPSSQRPTGPPAPTLDVQQLVRSANDIKAKASPTTQHEYQQTLIGQALYCLALASVL